MPILTIFLFLTSVENGKIMKFRISSLQGTYCRCGVKNVTINIADLKKYLAEKPSSVNTFYSVQSKYNGIHNLKIIAQL